MAVDQVAPLSSETSTISPGAVTALNVPLMVCDATKIMNSVLLVPLSAENATVATVVVGAVTSSTKAWLATVPSLPALSVTFTRNMLLPVSVWPASDQVFWPTVVAACNQVAPLTSKTSTCSANAKLDARLPLLVCAAVLVMRSVLLVPVSAEKVAVAMKFVGAVVSTSTFAVEPMLLSVSVVLLPAASVSVPPLLCNAFTVMPLASLSPGCTVYLNTSAVVPEPERLVA